MPRSLVARLLLAGVLLVTLLTAGAVIFVEAADHATDAWEDREDSEAVLDTVVEARSEVIDVETGLRGYQLTGSERLLEPTRAAMAELPRTMADLRRRTAGDSRLAAMAEGVDAEIDRYIRSHVLPLIADVRAGPRDREREAVAGKRQVDGLRTAFMRLHRAERAVQRASSDEVLASARRAKAIALAGLIGAVLLLGGFAVAVARGIVLPVRRVAHGADALARGELDVHVPEAGSGEIADLARAFNAMSERLRAARGELEGRVEATTAEVERARLETLERLALASEYRDDDTQQHAHRIGRTAAAIGHMLGLDARLCERLRRAAPLHDIGKVAVPDAILLKSGRLTADEFAVVREHAEVGGRILAGSESPVLRLAEGIARSHHERWDGGGYPAGLAGTDIPLAGRIVAVADVFDALTHERPYKPAWSVADALAEIRAGAGSQFDPAVVEAFDDLDHDALVGAMADEPPSVRVRVAA